MVDPSLGSGAVASSPTQNIFHGSGLQWKTWHLRACVMMLQWPGGQCVTATPSGWLGRKEVVGFVGHLRFRLTLYGERSANLQGLHTDFRYRRIAVLI
jgi:hypothetical protein